MRAQQDLRNGLGAALAPLAALAWRMLLTLALGRSVFLLFRWDAIRDAGGLGRILLDGLAFDLALVALLLAIPAAGLPFLALRPRLIRAWSGLVTTCLPCVLLVILLAECMTPSFVDPLAGRPPLIFFEYLRDPAGVAGALWAAFRAPIVVAAGFAVAATWLNVRRLAILGDRVRPVRFLPALAAAAVLLAGCLASYEYIAGTVAARPAPAITTAYNAGTARMARHGP